MSQTQQWLRAETLSRDFRRVGFWFRQSRSIGSVRYPPAAAMLPFAIRGRFSRSAHRLVCHTHRGEAWRVGPYKQHARARASIPRRSTHGTLRDRARGPARFASRCLDAVFWRLAPLSEDWVLSVGGVSSSWCARLDVCDTPDDRVSRSERAPGDAIGAAPDV